jgi:hypothetical protein
MERLSSSRFFRDIAFRMNMFTLRRFSVWLSVLTLLLAGSTSWGQSGSPRITNLEVGFDGRYKIGFDSPIRFDVTGPAGETFSAIVRVADPDGTPVLLPLGDVTLSEEGTGRVEGTFVSGRLEAPVQVELRRDGSVLDSRTLRAGERLSPLRQSAQLWLIVGEQPAFQMAAERWRVLQPRDLFALQVENWEESLPAGEGLEGVDLIVLSPDAAMMPETSERIRRWVKRGGRLVIPIGDGVAELQESPLSAWLPIRPLGQSDVRNLGGLNTILPRSQRLYMLGSVPAAELDAQQGRVLASGLGGPLILRAAYGVGQVTALAVPLNRAPLSNWDIGSNSDLAVLLADLVPPWKSEYRNAAATDAAGDLNPTGVSDLQTQLVHTLDHYDEVRRASHWVVLGWISLFILLVGPLDYLLWHRYVKRPHLTWMTLPAWIAGASLFAVTLGDDANEVPARGRQLEIIDVDATADALRVRAWMNFYSPRTQRFRIDPQPAEEWLSRTATSPRQRSRWADRPESGFRGMYRPGGIDRNKPEYTLSPDRRVIENLPVQVWSTGAVATEWEAPIQPEALVSSQLRDSGAYRVVGSFTHHLPGTLTDWFLAHGNFAYYPKSRSPQAREGLRPGEEWNLSEARSNILRGVLIGLTQASTMREDGKTGDIDVSREIYDPLSRDPASLVRTITFHDVAGSSGYTGLLNQSLRHLDLSSLLTLNRAVLYGRLQLPATRFEIDGETVSFEQQETFVRIILPVERPLRRGDTPPDPSLLKPR